MAAQAFAEPAPLVDISVKADAVAVALPINEVKASLPNYLEIAPQTFTEKGTHPVLLIFSKQSDVRYIGQPVGSGMTYDEAITFIPYVRVKGKKGVFSYMAQLHLNDMMPTYIGLRKYGYMKDFAQIEHTENLFAVTDALRGVKLLQSEANSAPLKDEEQFQKNGELVLKFLSTPVISNLNGALICSQFSNFKKIQFRPMQAKLELLEGIPGMGPTRKGQTLRVDVMDQKHFGGALQYEFDYTLSMPVAAKECR
jgi:hypothetical protein